MKKLISYLCTLAIILIASFVGIISAQAGTYEEESDAVFLKAFEQLLADENIIETNIEVRKEPVYDISLNQLGYVYSMNIGSNEGFALVINTNGMFDVTEIYLNAETPYNAFGQNIYVKLFVYLVYKNEEFFEPKTGLAINNDIIDKISENAFYSSSSTLYQTQEIIYYINRVPVNYLLAKKYPCYLSADLDNACTPTAGANIIGYYTRFYPELMNGFVPGSYMGDFFIYIEFTTEAYPLITKLHNYMGTNVVEPGTTIDGFKTGMTRYINEKGKSISYLTCMQSGNFNYEITKQKLVEGKPMVLFVDAFTVATLSDNAGRETITYNVGTLCHAMAGFGYNEITYTLTSGQTRTDKYIAISTGLGNYQKGYFNINYNTQIDEAFAISIY